MDTQTGQENGKLNRKRTISKMNLFTIPLRCLQRNAPEVIIHAFWPGVCGGHHPGSPRGIIGLSNQ
jgi:hypothetical protein